MWPVSLFFLKVYIYIYYGISITLCVLKHHKIKSQNNTDYIIWYLHIYDIDIIWYSYNNILDRDRDEEMDKMKIEEPKSKQK